MNTSAENIGIYLLKAQQKICCAESCTAGMISAAITDVSGSSAWFEMGFVTYSNQAKTKMLGVSEELLQNYGAVSEQVVLAMASGAQKKANSDWAIAVSGIAGPGGGSIEKPVGTVWFAFANPGKKIFAKCFQLQGDRLSIRQQATKIALDEMLIAFESTLNLI